MKEDRQIPKNNQEDFGKLANQMMEKFRKNKKQKNLLDREEISMKSLS